MLLVACGRSLGEQIIISLMRGLAGAYLRSYFVRGVAYGALFASLMNLFTRFLYYDLLFQNVLAYASAVDLVFASNFKAYVLPISAACFMCSCEGVSLLRKRRALALPNLAAQRKQLVAICFCQTVFYACMCPFWQSSPKLMNPWLLPFMAAFQQQILAFPISLLMWYPEQQQSPSLTKEGAYYNFAALWMQQYALSGFTSTPMPFSWKTPIRCNAQAFNRSANRICLRYSCIFTSILPQTATQLLSMHLMNSNLHWQSSNQAPYIYNDRAFSKFFLTPKPFSQHLPQFRNAFPHLSSVARLRYLIPRQRLEPLTVQDSLSPMRTYMAPRLFNALGNSSFLAMEQYLTACSRFGSIMQSYSWVPETSLWETAE